MAADGMTNRQIAQTLFVTVKAVQYHLTNVYRKLGSSDRAALAERLGHATQSS
jgi:DNA-binding NarL/FixJ family response regulator